MLPGFRFLVAAIVFSMSVLVFGLGAAALLRAAHEQFASNASWRATPALSLTSFLPQPELPPPTFAMLRIESSPPQPIVPTPLPPGVETAPVRHDVPAEFQSPQPELPSAAPPALPAAAAEPSRTVADAAALSPALDSGEIAKRDGADVDLGSAASARPDIGKPEILTPDLMTSDAPIALQPLVPQAVSPVVPATIAMAPKRRDAVIFTEAQVLASADIVTGASPSPNQFVTSPAPAAMSKSDAIALAIESLGDQPVAINKTASIRIAAMHLHQSLVKKRLAKARLAKEHLARERLAEARRAKLQRQMAQRARAARQAAIAQQQQPNADPFAQPQAFGQQAVGQQQAAARTR